MLASLLVMTSLAFAALDNDGDGFDADVDCNDADVQVHPQAVERCDGMDSDCDGEIDEDAVDALAWFQDADGDLWGDVKFRIDACEQPVGFVSQSGDCNDDETRTFPENTEVCDGIDNNCEAGIDEDSAVDVVTWYEDNDGDGYMNVDAPHQGCLDQTAFPWVREADIDCDDEDATVGPCSAAGSCSTSTGGTGAGGLAVLGLLAVARRRTTRAR